LIRSSATLRIKRIPEEKIVNIIVESGKKTRIYPFIKMRLKLGYEE